MQSSVSLYQTYFCYNLGAKIHKNCNKMMANSIFFCFILREDFSRPRIVYREIGDAMDACMVPPDIMINNKLYMVSGEYLEHLLRFFNSNLFNKTIFTKANLTGGKGIDFMKIIRIPLPSECDLSMCNEQDVDKLLYSFYGLSRKEVEYIENGEV